MNLGDKLQQFKDGVVSQLSPADVALMDEGTERLLRSGIVAHVKKAGEPAPDFTLPNSGGELIRLADQLSRGPVVVTFYRGVWWPYCNLQLQAYQEIQPEIKALGASMVAISPQKPEYSLSMAQKHELGFEVLSDEGNRVAREYGMVFKLDQALQELYKTKFKTDLAEYNADGTYELPLPGTFIVAPDGIIRFAFVEVDYTRRMEPADILERLKKLQP